jgi:hypothetical protein
VSNNNYKNLKLNARSVFYCECIVHYDDDNKIVHVLDDYKSGNTSITNGIDVIQESILSSLGVSKKITDVRWFLYATDCVVSEFKNGGFNFINKKDSLIDSTLLNLMDKLHKSRP